jgi:hypothetical protein
VVAASLEERQAAWRSQAPTSLNSYSAPSPPSHPRRLAERLRPRARLTVVVRASPPSSSPPPRALLLLHLPLLCPAPPADQQQLTVAGEDGGGAAGGDPRPLPVAGSGHPLGGGGGPDAWRRRKGTKRGRKFGYRVGSDAKWLSRLATLLEGGFLPQKHCALLILGMGHGLATLKSI